MSLQDNYTISITEVEAELLVAALDHLNARIEQADGSCTNLSHRCAGKFTKRQINKLIAKVVDAADVSLT